MKAVFRSAKPYADDALNLPVKDVESAIPYYERTFGFRVVERQESPHALTILARVRRVALGDWRLSGPWHGR
jgi:catechol 2,3-dioxygenase-like lactoylglutathione lyase family enzyme